MVATSSEIISIISLILAIACRSMSELALHGKLRWSKSDDSFWGEESHYRKYANPLDAPKDNWYYRLFNIGYKERFPLSATALIFLTDGYHFCQWAYHIFLSLTLALLYGFSYIVWGACWLLIVGVHSLVYHLLSKKV